MTGQQRVAEPAISGEAARYDREMTERERLLNDDSQPVVTLSPLSAVPKIFMEDALRPGAVYDVRPSLCQLLRQGSHSAGGRGGTRREQAFWSAPVSRKLLAAVCLVAAARQPDPAAGACPSYNHASYDDLGYSIRTHERWRDTGSFWRTVEAAAENTASIRYTWQGTFFSCFLAALQPALFGEGLVLDHHVGADGNVPAGAGRADPAAGSPGDGRGHGGMADPVFPFRAGNDAADPQHQRSLVLVERRHGLFDGVVLSGPSDGPVASSGGQPEGKSPVSAGHGAVKRGGGRRQFRHAAVRLRAGRAAAVLLLPAEGKEPLGQADLLPSHAGGLCLQHHRPGQRRAGADPFRGHERRQGHSGILLFRHCTDEPDTFRRRWRPCGWQRCCFSGSG